MRFQTIQARTVAVCAAAIVATVVVLVGVGAWQSASFSAAAEAETDTLVAEQLDGTVTGVVDLIGAQAEAVQLQVDGNLEVLGNLAATAGGVGPIDGTVDWQVVDQFTGEATAVALPRFGVGDQWFGDDPTADTMPLVDDLEGLVGGTATVFQRVNDDGDMLRVATNVRTLDGTRAIGTAIPATGPDGTPNAVVATVLGGETFRGNALVVDTWYATAYQPIVDAGEVIGMLYVGVAQESVASLRTAITTTSVGETGEVQILAGSGDARGEVRIARDLDNGTDRSGELDADGVAYLDELITDAVAAGDGTVVRARHELPDDGAVLLRAAYFEPWDWVVVASAPEVEFQAAHEVLASGRRTMTVTLLVAGLIAVVAFGFGGARLGARSVAGVVGRSAGALKAASTDLRGLATALTGSSRATEAEATRVSTGADDVSSSVASVATAVEELDVSVREIAGHASEASTVADEAVKRAADANGSVRQLDEASTQIGGIVDLITSIAEQTNLLALNATIEAARAGDAGRGFAVVAGEVKALADQTQQATANIRQRVGEIQTQTGGAAEAIGLIDEVIGRIADLQSTIAAAVEEQSTVSSEISRSVNEAAVSVGGIAEGASGVVNVASDTSRVAHDTDAAAEGLTELALQLDRLVGGGAGHDGQTDQDASVDHHRASPTDRGSASADGRPVAPYDDQPVEDRQPTGTVVGP